MRDLTYSECAVVSGSQADDAGISILAMGLGLGTMGAFAGGCYGAQYGVFGAVGGGLVGMIGLSVGIPCFVLATGVIVGATYHAMGFIDVYSMGTAQTA